MIKAIHYVRTIELICLKKVFTTVFIFWFRFRYIGGPLGSKDRNVKLGKPEGFKKFGFPNIKVSYQRQNKCIDLISNRKYSKRELEMDTIF